MESHVRDFDVKRILIYEKGELINAIQIHLIERQQEIVFKTWAEIDEFEKKLTEGKIKFLNQY